MKKKSRKLYLVTSVLANRKGCTSGPVLGVFTSKKKGLEHYQACVKHQTDYPGSKLCWNRPRTIDTNPSGTFQRVCMEAYIYHDDKSSHEISLEVWLV